ncbi:hypothetical protein ASF12_07745 [Paenibacillus sp. Leaf72]|nr:hypothetical protein ASF12_07745 [Paenibacillus sp. Leaf72]
MSSPSLVNDIQLPLSLITGLFSPVYQNFTHNPSKCFHWGMSWFCMRLQVGGGILIMYNRKGMAIIKKLKE